MIRIIALTQAGRCLAERIKTYYPYDSELWFKPQPFAEKVQHAFGQGDQLVFVCAMGIVVRTLAPVLQNKHQDPPVLVLDEAGTFVVPLLSGHEGGANQWGYELAEKLKAKLVLTTAQSYIEKDEPIYTVGMGCERNCPPEELLGLLHDCLQQKNLSIGDVHSINSVDIKADEKGLIECARQLGKSYQVFEKSQLASVDHLLSEKSDYVFNLLGIYSVAEAAALVAAKQAACGEAQLVLNKVKTKKATCAIAKSYTQSYKMSALSLGR